LSSFSFLTIVLAHINQHAFVITKNKKNPTCWAQLMTYNSRVKARG